MKTRISIMLLLLIAWPTASCNKKAVVAPKGAQAIEGVKIEEIRAAAFESYYEAAGTVRARTATVLSSKIMGSVIALHVREGDRVRQGQLLLEIDAREATAESRKARAGLGEAENALIEIERSIEAGESAKAAAEAQKALATSTFNRYRAMLEGKAVSQQEFDEVQVKHLVALTDAARAGKMLDVLEARKKQMLARIERARADLSTAHVHASYTRITSPINGIIIARQVDVGFTATPGAPLLTIEDDSRYQLEASVEESQISRIHIGDGAQVRIDAFGDQGLEGNVVEIVPASDPASRSYTVKVQLRMADGLPSLRSGMYGKALFTADKKQGLAVPGRAIIQRGQLVGVYVVDESGVARFRLIKTGKRSGERVEVLGGITDGDRVVTDRVEAVSDGGRVQ